jgi:predicted 2-oxoglutarate/Fe(II)-dependent dioxygenase YbiX
MNLGLYEHLKSGGRLVWTVPGVLTAAECSALVERIEALGPTDAPITVRGGFEHRPETRNNDRVMFDDAALAERVFNAVKHSLPAKFEGRAPCGANERFRCYRYQPGQYFRSHLDGSFRRNPKESSELTLMVYLNGDCEGGETAFEDPEMTVKPVAGTALLFFHALRHEGCEVRRGKKYVLRSDVMYREV